MKKSVFCLFILLSMFFVTDADAASNRIEGCLAWGRSPAYVSNCLSMSGAEPSVLGGTYVVVSDMAGDIPMSFVFGFEGGGLSGVIGAIKDRPFSGDLFKRLGEELVRRYGDPVNIQQDLMALFWRTGKGDVRMYPETVDGKMNVVVVITPPAVRS